MLFRSSTLAVAIGATSISAFSPSGWTTFSQGVETLKTEKAFSRSSLFMGRRRSAFITENMTTDDESVVDGVDQLVSDVEDLISDVMTSLEKEAESTVEAISEEGIDFEKLQVDAESAVLGLSDTSSEEENVDEASLEAQAEAISLEEEAESTVEAISEEGVDFEKIQVDAESAVEEDIGALLDTYSKGETVDEASLEAQAEALGVNIAEVDQSEDEVTPVDNFSTEQTLNDSDFESSVESEAEALGVKVAEKLDIIPELEIAAEDSTENEIESQPEALAKIAVESESETSSIAVVEEKSNHEQVHEQLERAEPAGSIHGTYPPNLKCKTYQFRSRENKGVVVLKFNDRS